MISGLLSDLEKHATVPSFTDSLDHLNRRGNAATAMMTTTKLEQWLKVVLIEHFANSPRRLMDRMFDYKGALGTFSAKIDMAYALGVISQNGHRNLHILRDIRNGFAHADDYMDFDHESMSKHFDKIEAAESRELAFLKTAVACIQELKSGLDVLMLANALRGSAPSRGKSQ